jgi:hypothetical protein
MLIDFAHVVNLINKYLLNVIKTHPLGIGVLEDVIERDMELGVQNLAGASAGMKLG